MKKEYKYELLPYDEMRRRGLKKAVCPQCGKQRMSQYVNAETRELAGDEFGLCERRIECGYNYYPQTEWVERETKLPDAPKILRLPPNAFTSKADADALKHPKERSTFDRTIYAIMRRLRGAECVDEFTAFMREMGVTTQDLIRAEPPRPGTAFWLLDEHGRPCDAQLKDFVKIGGTLRTHKYKSGKAVINTAHSVMRNRGIIEGNSRPPRCLFGLHRIAKTEGLTVHVFESPKTAVLMTLWAAACQQFRGEKERLPLCVSAMNLTGLRWLWRDRDHYDRMAPIIQRHPRWVLHPDLKAEAKWQEDADGLKTMYGGVWQVDTSLRRFATAEQSDAGWDWGDFAFAGENNLICDADLMAYARVPKERDEEPEPIPAPKPAPIESELAQVLAEPPPPDVQAEIEFDERSF